MGIEDRGKRTKEAILVAAIALWRAEGLHSVTARRIGAVINLTHGAVLYHFGNAREMVGAVARRAVCDKDDVIVPQLIASRHPATINMTADEKREYLKDY